MANTSVNALFNNRLFEIPKYQRGYAWEKDNIRDLFDDIFEAQETNSNHYIGTVVLSKSPTRANTYHIVDGQQRITTLLMLINALIAHLDGDEAFFNRLFYIAKGKNFRLSHLGRDKDFFIALLSGKAPIPQTKSQRLMAEAYEEIEAQVALIKDKSAFLGTVENLELLEFIENSEGDAIRIFQTVNDRGKPLTNMEKAKSLLIYFSNRYLNKKLDDYVNDAFGEIFEMYDDIKLIGEAVGITTIKSQNFTEDNFMRYHFVTFSTENFEPTAEFVLNFLKREMSEFRKDKNKAKLEKFIKNYTDGLKAFFVAFKQIVEKAQTNEYYYKIFAILGISATIYPLMTRLQMRNLLDKPLPSEKFSEYTFLRMLELIDVRVYKTKSRSPTADIAYFSSVISNKSEKEIEDWLLWFNHRWMTKEQFLTQLNGPLYGNSALPFIFLTYSESLKKKPYTLEQLQVIVKKVPTIEHILAQSPKFSARSHGFRNEADFLEYIDALGNLTLLEKSLNSQAQDKVTLQKVTYYDRSTFNMTKALGTSISTNKKFTKQTLAARTDQLVAYCADRWWSVAPK